MPAISKSTKSKNFRIGIYGGGGMGKTTLASMSPKCVILDLEKGLGHLPPQDTVVIATWSDLRNTLKDFAALAPFDTIVLDTITAAEDFCIKYICQAFPINGQPANGLADYDWGKGSGYLFEQMKLLLGDLENLFSRGKNIVVVAHEEIARAPNPTGDDYLRYEPRLQNSPKCNIRAKFKEWVDVLGHISFDMSVEKGKAKDTNSHSIYTEDTPIRMAKCRGKLGVVPYALNSNLFWQKVFTQ